MIAYIAALASFAWLLSGSASAQQPFTDPSQPDSLRIISLNVAGISKPEGPDVSRDEYGNLDAANLERANIVLRAFQRQLAAQSRESDDRNEPVLFATTEATGMLDKGELTAGSCSYLGSPYGSVLQGLAALDGSYQPWYQSWPCNGGGVQGNDFSTNADVELYESRDIPDQCHNLGAQAIKVRFGATDWMWVVNTHLPHKPEHSVDAFEDIVDWVRRDLATPWEWENAPILVVGDFNLTADGYDSNSNAWPRKACKNLPTPPGETSWWQTENEDGVLVGMGIAIPQSEHAQGSARFEAFLSDNDFEHFVDRRLPTFKAGPKPSTRIDYAVIRNNPEGRWSYGHRYHPRREVDGALEYWTDHIGIAITVRRPPPEQLWLLTQ